jgi:hypothetical protein
MCNLHPWMRSYVFVFAHPYFDVTQTDGSFDLKGHHRSVAGKIRYSGPHCNPRTKTIPVPKLCIQELTRLP